MAYQAGRKKQLCEILELVDDNGDIALSVDVKLDLDAIASGFNHKYNEIIRSEQALKQMRQSGCQDMDTILENYGTAVINIFQLLFGEEGTQKILDFYEGKYIEMSQEIFPFIINKVAPAIKDAQQQNMRNARNNYKSTQRRAFGKR